MKKMIYLSAMLALTMCASSAFAQDTMKSDGNMKSDAKMSKNADGKFMMMAAVSGMNEIGLSSQAVSKSSNDDVKSFAQKMVDDHTMAGDELKSLAAMKNVTLPMEADAKHKAAMEKMSKLSGEAFDMAYIKMIVGDHEKVVAMFKKEADGGKDADAKAFAAKTLPTLQMHLDMARGMMTKMSGSKKMGGTMKDGM